jgi:hypothetical protein
MPNSIEVLGVLADELPHVSFFYYTLKELSAFYGAVAFRVSPAKLAEKYAPRGVYTEKQARFAIGRLVDLGFISASGESRRFTLVEVYRLGGTVRGTEKGTAEGIAKSRKKQRVLKTEGTARGTEKGTEQGDGLDVVVDVDVLSSGSEEALQTSFVASSEATPTPIKIPYDELRTAYNERRGALPEARPFSDAAKQKIKTRWLAHPDIEFWKTLFVKAGKSEMMVSWGDFHWFMKSELNVEKTLNGNYDNDRDRKTVPRHAPPAPPREKMAPAPELTQEDQDDMHRQAVAALGPRMCKTSDCRVCGKVPTAEEVAAVEKFAKSMPTDAELDRELEELPV